MEQVLDIKTTFYCLLSFNFAYLLISFIFLISFDLAYLLISFMKFSPINFKSQNKTSICLM